MSIENVMKFVDQLAKDEELQNKVDFTMDPDEIVSVANAAGFAFSKEDLAAAPPPQSSLTELSDRDLDAVAAAGKGFLSIFGCKGGGEGGGGGGGGGGGTENPDSPKITTTHSTGCPIDESALFCGDPKPEGPLGSVAC